MSDITVMSGYQKMNDRRTKMIVKKYGVLFSQNMKLILKNDIDIALRILNNAEYLIKIQGLEISLRRHIESWHLFVAKYSNFNQKNNSNHNDNSNHDNDNSNSTEDFYDLPFAFDSIQWFLQIFTVLYVC